MGERIEVVKRVHNEYVKYDCVQLMLGYENYAQIYGNGELMFNHYLLKDIYCTEVDTAHYNIDEINKYVNAYLSDERRTQFPFSSTPYHVEKKGLFRKINFTNQIFDYDKPYVRVSDGIITRMTAYKDGNSAIVDASVIDNEGFITKRFTISKTDFEQYLRTGTLAGYDNNNYKNIRIFDRNGGLYTITLESNEYYNELTKDEVIRCLSVSPLTERAKRALKQMVASYDGSLEYPAVRNKKMIKLEEDGNICIDNFSAFYTGKDEYTILISKVPINKETLDDVKRRIDFSKIDYANEPMINKNTKLNKKKILFN